jgi:crotonobetainyl-CoA:carnitine CoA-transferase CaiB-like acyl-CoA transferase
VTGPLEGLTVVEIGQYIAAPYAGVVLADLGARVIKVEPPDGDGIQSWGPHINETSAPYVVYNRNKEVVTADLTLGEDREVVRQLIGGADIVVENNRPGVLARFGLDAESTRHDHPHIIYCSITGYGSDSAYASRPGFDLVIQGITGLIGVTGTDDAPMAKVPVPIVDGTASLHATTAIMAAVYRREHTGEGATIDISLQASTMTWMMLLAAGYFAAGDIPGRIGAAHPFAAPYEVFRAADGPMTIAAGNERQWHRLCAALGLKQLLDDPRFRRNADRARHREDLAPLIEEALSCRPRAEWIAELSDSGIPCGPVNSFAEALEDPALVERGVIVSFRHPEIGEVTTIGSPIIIDAHEAPLRPITRS